PKTYKPPITNAEVARYLMQPRIFDLLEATRAGTGGEIQLTDAIAALLSGGRMLAYRFEGRRFDCGSRMGLIEATLQYALEDDALAEPTRTLMRAALSATR
ncbi:MAG: UTP--glucose-1-phosphate uridylyltransferase, partial [Lysobacteraceae bacterium]